MNYDKTFSMQVFFSGSKDYMMVITTLSFSFQLGEDIFNFFTKSQKGY